MTDFVETSIRERAERTIRAHEVTVMAKAHARDFADAIVTPPQPNDRLRDAAAFFDAVMGERQGALCRRLMIGCPSRPP